MCGMKKLGILIFAVVTLMAQDRKPLVAVGGIMHESNSFHSVPTRLEDFNRRPATGDLLKLWADNNDEVAGFIEGAGKYGLALHPTMVRSATPSGPVTDAAFEVLTEELIALLKKAPKLDGLLLALHGAMVTPKYPHADAEVTRRVREALGRDFPIVVTHDFHANISPEIVEYSTALLTYKEVPHIDQKERGLKAAWIMSRILLGGVKPAQAIVKPGMLYNIRYQNTNVEPLLPIVTESKKLEQQAGILAASVSGGYQYADVPAMGATVVVVTEGDADRAKREAQRLSDMLWATRDRLKLQLPDAGAAVRQAMGSDVHPVTLVEMGDNIGGGSAGDSTFMLSELVKQRAKGWVVAMYDPAAVQAAVKLGVGGAFDMPVGGKVDKAHGAPVQVRGTVKLIYDGKFMDPAVRHGGQRYYDQGLSAVIEAEGSERDLSNYVLLTSKRMVPFSLHQLYSAGIQPERQRILVVKAAVAFRAAYEPLNGRIIEVDTPGATAVNPARFEWKRVPEGLFGLRD
jgi:microcystin degradation protein MlrC